MIERIVRLNTAPEGRYRIERQVAEGGTNTDDLTDILRDLPVVLVEENTNTTWNREHEVPPLDRATFRDPKTAAEIRAEIEVLMELR